MFEDPKFWLTVSFILFVILMIKPFKSMMIGGLDQKIEEIKLDEKEKSEFNHSIEAVKKLWEAASAIDPDLKK